MLAHNGKRYTFAVVAVDSLPVHTSRLAKQYVRSLRVHGQRIQETPRRLLRFTPAEGEHAHVPLHAVGRVSRHVQGRAGDLLARFVDTACLTVQRTRSPPGSRRAMPTPRTSTPSADRWPRTRPSTAGWPPSSTSSESPRVVHGQTTSNRRHALAHRHGRRHLLRHGEIDEETCESACMSHVCSESPRQVARRRLSSASDAQHLLAHRLDAHARLCRRQSHGHCPMCGRGEHPQEH